MITMRLPLIDHAFKLVSGWIDDTVPVEQLHEFITEQVLALVSSDTAPERLSEDSLRVMELAYLLGFLNPVASSFPVVARSVLPPARVAAPDGIDTWRESLPGGMVVSKGVITPQSGRFLDSLASSGPQRPTEFVSKNIERLLRHVEIKRDRSIEKFTRPLTGEAARLERHDVAILFARHALRSRDFRLLNAGFKLNDWSFPLYRKRGLSTGLSRYLLALLEQEYSARELLRI